MKPVIYGIKNCDTMKKALKWLDAHGIEYRFHDYKKEGLDEAAFQQAVSEHGWETVINRRGTSWRKLSDDTKGSMDNKQALNAANENPSLVKRPLLLHNGKTVLGFDEGQYKTLF